MATRYTKIEFYIAENLPTLDNIPMYYTPPIRGTSLPLSPSTEIKLTGDNEDDTYFLTKFFTDAFPPTEIAKYTELSNKHTGFKKIIDKAVHINTLNSTSIGTLKTQLTEFATEKIIKINKKALNTYMDKLENASSNGGMLQTWAIINSNVYNQKFLEALGIRRLWTDLGTAKRTEIHSRLRQLVEGNPFYPLFTDGTLNTDVNVAVTGYNIADPGLIFSIFNENKFLKIYATSLGIWMKYASDKNANSLDPNEKWGKDFQRVQDLLFGGGKKSRATRKLRYNYDD